MSNSGSDTEDMTCDRHHWQDYKNLMFYYNKKFIGNFIKCLTEKTEHDDDDDMMHYASMLPKLKYTFDLEGTLITTNSGNKQPDDEFDWRFTNGVKDFLKNVAEKEDLLLVVIANQANLKTAKSVDKTFEFKSRVNAMSNEIMNIFNKRNNNVFLLYVFSLDSHDIIYHKPFPGMWNILQICMPFKDSYDPIIYIGDSAGRITDSSCVDRKFARNAGMKFATPENFFCGDEEMYFDWGFNPSDYLIIPAHLPNAREQMPDIKAIFADNEKHAVLLMGYHGSGKTTLAKYISQTSTKKFIAISESVHANDIEAAHKHIYKIIKNNQGNIIIDYCNCTTEDRLTWINFIKGLDENIKIIVFEMTTPKELSMHLNIVKYRKKKINRNNASMRAYNTYEKEFCDVDLVNEEVTSHYKIPFIPAFDADGKRLMDFLIYS
jgi:bifunctional polynucleotide phosphatase/kinase